MTTHFDPWDDASILAERILPANSRLNIIVGAEAWCARCRDLRPQYDAMLDTAPADETWLWLDLEDHAEFVGDYVPDNLPVLLKYRGSHMIVEQLLNEEPLLAQLDGLVNGDGRDGALQDSGIRERLLAPNWAIE